MIFLTGYTISMTAARVRTLTGTICLIGHLELLFPDFIYFFPGFRDAGFIPGTLAAFLRLSANEVFSRFFLRFRLCDRLCFRGRGLFGFGHLNSFVTYSYYFYDIIAVSCQLLKRCPTEG